jgi:hypothetical protein
MFIFFGALFAFTTTIVAVLRYDEMKARLNPRDKLRISPSHWFTKEGPEESQILTEIQIGCEIQNTATFPITFRITNLRTTFDGMTKVSDNFPLADVELLSLETGYPRDETLNPVGCGRSIPEHWNCPLSFGERAANGNTMSIENTP